MAGQLDLYGLKKRDLLQIALDPQKDKEGESLFFNIYYNYVDMMAYYNRWLLETTDDQYYMIWPYTTTTFFPQLNKPFAWRWYYLYSKYRLSKKLETKQI
jgi:hypothetical protein